MSQKEQLQSANEGEAREEGEDKEPFLRRWSRLKADSAVRPEKAAVPAPSPGEAAETSGGDGQDAGEPEALPPGDEDMPPLESLDANSDFSGFMSPRVSAALRKQALRKLFHSQKFNVISELDDYIADYRSFPALGDILTADMKHTAARLLEKQLAADAADAAAAERVAPDGEHEAGVAGADAVAAEHPEEENTKESGEPDDSDSEAPERDA